MANKLRKFQIETRHACDDLAAGDPASKMLIHVTQGGGKSSVPHIMLSALAKKGYRVCWVVPRDNLRTQGSENFTEPIAIELFGEARPLDVLANYHRLSDESSGYITTYQAICAAPGVHKNRLGSGKWVLILDEFHHVSVSPKKTQGEGEEERSYYGPISALFEIADLRVLMTGSLSRHDRRKIAFVRYTEISKDSYMIQSPDGNPDWKVITYTREDAEADEAIVPLQFTFIDGRDISWAYGDKRETVELLSKATDEQLPRAIRVATQTDYAYDMIRAAHSHWSEYRQDQYPSAKLLIVAPDIETAEMYQNFMADEMGIVAPVATSKEPTKARMNMHYFRNGPGRILITVGMAYEGFDVKDITHVCCLTQIRSSVWLEQLFCRANRRNDANDKKMGFVFCMDDYKTARAFEEMSNPPSIFSDPREINMEPDEQGERQPVEGGESTLGRARVETLGKSARRSAMEAQKIVTLAKEVYLMSEQADDTAYLNFLHNRGLVDKWLMAQPIAVSRKAIQKPQAEKLRALIADEIKRRTGDNILNQRRMYARIKQANGDRGIAELELSELFAVHKLVTTGQGLGA